MSADRPLNILVLHGMGPRESWVSSWADVELMFPRIDTRNRYLVHDCSRPVPPVLKSFDFDAVVMMSTFMDWVKDRRPGDPRLEQYAFLRTSVAHKIVFAQDDYWLSEVRDAFYTDSRVDAVYSVIEPQHWPHLMPRYARSSGVIRQGYTTYLSERMLSLGSLATPWERRVCDVVYRAAGRPTFPNKLGVLKANLGEMFASALGEGHGLVLDLSTDPARFIRGDKWYEFIVGSKAILGSKSGSGVNVRSYDVVERLQQFLESHPGASYQDVEQAVFLPSDTSAEFTGVSPRNVEAAMLGTLQILVEGHYGGFLRPQEHFVPLREDMSNARDVLELLRNPERCGVIADSCRATLLAQRALYPEHVVGEVLELVREGRGRRAARSAREFERMETLYGAQLRYALFKRDMERRRGIVLETIRPWVRAVLRR